MDKRKKIFLSISLVAVCILIFFIYKNLERKNQILSGINKLPNFHFRTIDGNEYLGNDKLKDETLILIYFNTECEHCIYEVEEIIRNIKRFSYHQIILVSSETTDKIIVFKEKFQLQKYSNIILLQTDAIEFYNTFGTMAIPSVFIYTDNQLVKKFKGEVKIEAIYNILNQ